jgi:hypothetical protein
MLALFIFIILTGLVFIGMIVSLANTGKNRLDGDDDVYYSTKREQSNPQHSPPFYPPYHPFMMQQPPIFSPDREYVWDGMQGRWVHYGNGGVPSVVAGILAALVIALLVYLLLNGLA